MRSVTFNKNCLRDCRRFCTLRQLDGGQHSDREISKDRCRELIEDYLRQVIRVVFFGERALGEKPMMEEQAELILP